MAMIRLLEIMIAALYGLDRRLQAVAGCMRRSRAALISWRRLLPLQANGAMPEIERGHQPLDGIEGAEHRPSVLA